MNPELPLRDIRPASPVEWWPPAPGWWLLAAVLLLTAAWLVWRAARALRRARRRRALLAEYAQVTATGGAPERLASAGAFLKRLLIHELGRREAAAACGARWTDLLCEPWPEERDLRDAAVLVAEVAYQPGAGVRSPDGVDALARRWIDHAVSGGGR